MASDVLTSFRNTWVCVINFRSGADWDMPRNGLEVKQHISSQSKRDLSLLQRACFSALGPLESRSLERLRDFLGLQNSYWPLNRVLVPLEIS